MKNIKEGLHLFSSLLGLVFLVILSLSACLPRHRVVFEKRLEEPLRWERRESRGVQYGMASWYGPEFHGRRTSSGEIYDMYELTCAHNTLALGTMVLVTNLENGRSLELRVNDRGPFTKDRIIDLSYAAAKILGVYEKGTAFVKVETLGPWIEEVPRYSLQIGSFSEEGKAKQLANELRKDFKNVYMTIMETSTQRYHRVRIGPFESKEEALSQAERLTQMGFTVLVTTR